MAVAKKKGRKKVRYEAPKMNFAEVNLKDKNYPRLFYNALHFAQYEMNNKTLAKNVHQYAKDKKFKKEQVAALKAIDDRSLEVLGKYATILVGGGELTPTVMAGFEKLLFAKIEDGKAILAAKKAADKEAAKNPATCKVTVQDRIRDQAVDVAAVFDGWLDQLASNVRAKTDEMDPLGEMQKAGFKAPQARFVKEFYEGELVELKAVLAGNDEELKEGYSNLKKTQVTRMVKLIEDILAAVTMVSAVTKAKRKPRVKKAPSLEKRVARIKFKEQDAEYGVASLNPVNIVGAKEVWTFNTKYRKLGKYVAQDEGGLGVKGTNITDFNESLSVQKSLRKPKEQLAELMKAGKVQLRKFMENIKGVEHKMKPRTNEHMIILRVVK
jgi:hypothetical protein